MKRQFLFLNPHQCFHTSEFLYRFYTFLILFFFIFSATAHSEPLAHGNDYLKSSTPLLWFNNQSHLVSDIRGSSGVAAVVSGSLSSANITKPIQQQNAEPSAEKSVLNTTDDEISVDEQTDVNLALRDAQNTPLPGHKVTFYSSLASATFGEVAEFANGIYKAKFSATQPGAYEIMVMVDDQPLSGISTDIVVRAGMPDEANSTLSATPNIIQSDGTTHSKVTLILKDKYHHPVANQHVEMLTSLGELSPVTQNEGTYTAELTSTESGEANISVLIDGKEFKSIIVLVKPGSVVGSQSEVSTDKKEYTAGDKIKVVTRLKDKYGNIITGDDGFNVLKAAKVAVGGAAVMQAPVEWRLKGDDEYEADMWIAKTPGTSHIVMLTFGPNNQTSSSHYIINTGPASGLSYFYIQDSSLSVGDKMKFYLVLKDSQNNFLSEAEGLQVLKGSEMKVPGAVLLDNEVIWSYKGGNFRTESWEASRPGTYLATLDLGNNVIVNADYPYSITSNSVLGSKSEVSTNSDKYAPGDKIKIVTRLKDKYENIITGDKAMEVLKNTKVVVQGAAEQFDAIEWKLKGEDEYEADVWTAKSVGKSYTATLIFGENNAKSSASYDIAIGSVSGRESEVSTNYAEYAVDDRIKVVTRLRDGNKNIITGDEAMEVLKNTKVVVQGAAEQHDVIEWKLKGEDEYEADVWTAESVGKSYTATLIFGENNTKSSASFTIVPGAVSVNNSNFVIYESSYSTGQNMRFNVSLRDRLGNPLTKEQGLNSLNKAEMKVPGADKGGDIVWSTTGTGYKTDSWVARIPGTDYEATLDFGNNVILKTSYSYTITSGSVSGRDSEVSTNSDKYTAGDKIKVVTRLKDKYMNIITGDEAMEVLKNTQVVVQGAAEQYDAIEWKLKGKDEYEADVWTAKSAGKSYTATLIFGENNAKSSASYDIAIGSVSGRESKLSTDRSEYTAGNNINLSIQLKDSQGNVILGNAGLEVLKDARVIVPGTAVESTNWMSKDDIFYTNTRTAQTAGSEYVATVEFGAGNVSESGKYSINKTIVDAGHSSLSTQADKYQIGKNIDLRIFMRDRYGNPYSDASTLDALNKADVVVPGAINNNKVSWTLLNAETGEFGASGWKATTGSRSLGML